MDGAKTFNLCGCLTEFSVSTTFYYEILKKVLFLSDLLQKLYKNGIYVEVLHYNPKRRN